MSATRVTAGLFAAIVLAGAAHSAVVEVAVNNVSDDRGHVRVELCTRDTFLSENCPYEGSAPSVRGATLVTIANVPPGEYAAVVFHDDTDQGVVHQNFLGIPREQIGFSNDARLHAKGPRFSDAAFMVAHEIERISLRVRHLFR